MKSFVERAALRVATAQITSDSEGLYVSVIPTRRTVDALRHLHRVLEKAGLKSRMPLADWHITVVYSEVPIKDIQTIYDDAKLDAATVFLANATEVEYWEGHKNQGVIVLKFDSPALADHNKLLQDLGYTATFPEYQAHMTLASDIHPEITEEKARELVAILNKELSNVDDLEFTGIRAEDLK